MLKLFLMPVAIGWGAIVSPMMSASPGLAEPEAKLRHAACPADWTVGGRVGVPLRGSCHFGDVFVGWSPEGWGLEPGEDWVVRLGVTAGVGMLGDGHRNAVLLHLGPYAEVLHRPTGLRVLGRSEPLLLSRHRFGSENLGEDFQFVSSMGLFWREESSGWMFGVAYQHISNAGLARSNPGTDHVLFSLARRF